MTTIDLAKIAEIVTPVVAGHGLELVDVEWKTEGAGWVLRVYIDRPGSEPKPGQPDDDRRAHARPRCGALHGWRSYHSRQGTSGHVAGSDTDVMAGRRLQALGPDICVIGPGLEAAPDRMASVVSTTCQFGAGAAKRLPSGGNTGP